MGPDDHNQTPMSRHINRNEYKLLLKQIPDLPCPLLNRLIVLADLRLEVRRHILRYLVDVSLVGEGVLADQVAHEVGIEEMALLAGLFVEHVGVQH